MLILKKSSKKANPQNIVLTTMLLILCVLLLPLCISACSRSSITAGPPYSTLPDNYDGKKTVITVMSLSQHSYIDRYVDVFNQQSNKYIINIEYYYKSNDINLTDYIQNIGNALKSFNEDLMAGYSPDIVVCNERMPVQSYINKELFADLYTFLDNDADFDKNNYLLNALTACEQEGRLYVIFPAFTIETMYMKSSDAADMQNWDTDGFLEYISSLTDVKYPVGIYLKNTFMTEMIPLFFIRYDTGEININRTELIKLFEIAERFPAQHSDEMEVQALIGMRDDNIKIKRAALSGPRSIREWEQVYAGEEISVVGYPRPAAETTHYGPTGISYFSPVAQLAVVDKAEEKEGAWEFIKFMLDYNMNEYYNTDSPIPINLSLIDYLLEHAKNDSYGEEYSIGVMADVPEMSEGSHMRVIMGPSDSRIWEIIDKDGNVEASGEMINIPVGNNTDEDNTKFMEIIKSVDKILVSDDTVKSIIEEEIKYYYSGQYTIDRLADAIESRVSLYLNEKK